MEKVYTAEETKVKRFTFDGKKYLLDETTNELYDVDTHNVIGKLAVVLYKRPIVVSLLIGRSKKNFYEPDDDFHEVPDLLPDDCLISDGFKVNDTKFKYVINPLGNDKFAPLGIYLADYEYYFPVDEDDDSETIKEKLGEKIYRKLVKEGFAI